MDTEVAVVGGGIGGLTVAALLAQRGVKVCLFEREPRVGGCVASFDKFGYRFDPTYGLFTSWESGEIHDRVFAELPVKPPEVHLMDPSYVVRLPDQSEIALGLDEEMFEEHLRRVFPECANIAVEFYRRLALLGTSLRNILQRAPDFLSASKSRRAFALLREGRIGMEIRKAGEQSTFEHLAGASARFRRFVDVQLQTLAQGSTAEVPYLRAALTLNAARRGMFGIRGGAAALAERLAESIKTSGGRIRLDTPVLRLSYNSDGAAIGIDLLSGETVTASKAIISNLTVWDTYGKLVGLNRTPTEIRKQLNQLRGWGAYLLYLALDEDAAATIVSEHVMALTDWQDGQEYSPNGNQLLFAAAPSWDARAPDGKRAVTVHNFTDVDEWFTFHKDATDLEQKDQEMLEGCWARLHAAMPGLGGSLEVIETATPRTFYDSTRRKLGMVGGTVPSPDGFWLNGASSGTSLPNLFIVSDTTSPGGIPEVSRAALELANLLTH